jgi:hypothetical protein
VNKLTSSQSLSSARHEGVVDAPVNPIKAVGSLSGQLRHHLFGFHDVSPWSGDYRRMLALQVERIDHPPLADTAAAVGVIDMASGTFLRHDDTSGWNFPQGARQIWLADGKRYAYNCPDGPVPRCRIRNETGELVRELPWGVAAVHPVSDELFSIDFGRVHRAGGYGHTGAIPWQEHAATRGKSGLIKVNVTNGSATQLVSLEECRRAAGGAGSANASSCLDYVTHVVPGPSGNRVAFLYRSWLADGGLDTALCVVDASGGGFRVLLRGNLSHFDWRDDESIVIWGPRSQFVTALRGRGSAKRGWSSVVLRRIKDVVRPFIKGTGLLSATFLRVPLDGAPPQPFCAEMFTGDGHPSFRPTDRAWMLCDTYPDRNDNRDLFLVDTAHSRKYMLGVFVEPRLPLNASKINHAVKDVDEGVLKLVGRERYARARSGLHCDLHPRWRRDGGQVAFDSLHDGTRQIYTINTSEVVTQPARSQQKRLDT